MKEKLKLGHIVAIGCGIFLVIFMIYLAMQVVLVEPPTEPIDQNTTKAEVVKEPKPTDQNTTKAEPVKELTLEESVLGEYEYKEDANTFKLVFLENGIIELYVNGEKSREDKWSIIDGQINVHYHPDAYWVFRINTDKSITHIARISLDGLREDYIKEKGHQGTYIKIK